LKVCFACFTARESVTAPSPRRGLISGPFTSTVSTLLVPILRPHILGRAFRSRLFVIPCWTLRFGVSNFPPCVVVSTSDFIRRCSTLGRSEPEELNRLFLPVASGSDFSAFFSFKLYPGIRWAVRSRFSVRLVAFICGFSLSPGHVLSGGAHRRSGTFF